MTLFTQRIIWIFYACSLLLFTPLQAQDWQRIHPFETLEHLRDVYVDEAGFGWAVGLNGVILKTETSGESWTVIESGLEVSFESIEYLPNSNGQTAFAVANQLYRTQDGGQSWSLFPTDGVNTRTLYLTSEQIWYSLAFNGKIFKTEDAGQNWTEIQDGIGEDTEMLEFIDPDHGWALGESGLVHYTTDGGENWMQTDPTVFGEQAIIRFANPSTGYLSNGKDLYKSTDGGANWTLVGEDVFSGDLFFMELVDDQKIVGTRGIRVYLSSDGGATWEQFNPIANSSELKGLHALPNGKLWAVSTYMIIGHTEDFSDNWVDQVPGVKASLRDVDIHESGWGLIAGNNGATFVTSDFGQNWDYIAASGNFLSATVTEESTLWTTTFGGINRSTDGGQNWTNVLNTPGGFVFDLEVISPDEIWTVNTNGELIHTTDGGENWTIEVLPDEPGLRKIRFIDANTAIITGNDGLILRSTDGGQNWETIESPISNNLEGVHFSDAQNGWIFPVTITNQILRTEDGGQSWVVQELPLASFWYDIEFGAPAKYYLVGGSASGGFILTSEDEGSSWENVRSTSIPYAGITFSDNTLLNSADIWLVGGGGNIELMTDLVDAVEEPAPESLSISPNPGAHYFEIQWPDEEAGRLTVYTIDGRLLHSQAVGASDSRIDTQGWNPGMYVLMFHRNGGVHSQKWVKH